MTGSVVRQTQWAGLDAVTLENGLMRVTVVPALGGHVAELVDLTGGGELLWRNPRLTPRPAPFGAWFDDWWSGGWDEIFPSGDQGRLHGELLPYMGELWCQPWVVGMGRGAGSAWIHGSVQTTVAAARFERMLELRAGEPVLRVSYRIRNLDVRPLPFTWGIHPAFAATPRHRIDHPGREMLVGVSSDPSLGEVGTGFSWPDLPDPSVPGGMRDASRVRAREDAVFGGHWATDLPEGWLALTNTLTRRGVAIVFDREVFPHAWLWQVYGGWRGHHHVALEAWTSHPMELVAAIEAGRERVLEPDEELVTEVAFVVYRDLDAVTHVGGHAEGFAVR